VGIALSFPVVPLWGTRFRNFPRKGGFFLPGDRHQGVAPGFSLSPLQGMKFNELLTSDAEELGNYPQPIPNSRTGAFE
jgi:hypothetical protein